jgi:DNA-binding transcriptional ArsR family regulator
VLVIETSPDDVLASRFAVSPVGETARLLTSLTRGPGPDTALLRRLRSSFEPIARTPEVRLLSYLHGPGSGADFAAPPPESMAQSIFQDAAAIAAASPSTVRTELELLRAHRSPPAELSDVLADPALPARVADAVLAVWHAVVEPEWPRIFTVLQRDVRFRAERLSRDGWGAALAGIHKRLTWNNGEIAVSRFPDSRIRLDGRGLLFIPSVFVAPGVALTTDAPWQPSITYPARGIGTLSEGAAEPLESLSRLLGPTRAQIVSLLSEPASTTQLGVLTGVSLSGISGHLGVLRDAGLITRERAGRSVLYRLTPIGETLHGAARAHTGDSRPGVP